AFQRGIARDAIAGELHPQADGDPIALVLGHVVVALNERVGRRADEPADIGLLEHILKELPCPLLDGKRMVYTVFGVCHRDLLLRLDCECSPYRGVARAFRLSRGRSRRPFNVRPDEMMLDGVRSWDENDLRIMLQKNAA